jgi:uncharacterized protein YkwD
LTFGMRPLAAAVAALLGTALASAGVFAQSPSPAPMSLGHFYAPAAASGCRFDGWYCHPASGSGSTSATGSTASTSAAASGRSSASATGAGSAGLTAPDKHMLTLVNRARVQAGLGALRVNTTLERLAKERAAVMAADGTLTESVPGYGLAAQMEAAAGYVASASGGEDSAEAGSVDQAFALFRGSPPHWANILYPSYTQVGIAVANTQDGEIIDILFSGDPD